MPFPLCCLALAFKLTNAALIIGCILQHFALSIFPTLPPSPPASVGFCPFYNGLSQCAAVELDFCLCLQQHSADPLIEGLCEERPEAAEGLQSCGLKQPASDKQRGPPGERSFEEKHRKTLGQKKRKHEIRPECSSKSLQLGCILMPRASPNFIFEMTLSDFGHDAVLCQDGIIT